MADYGTSKMSKELVMALFDTLGMEIDSGYKRRKLALEVLLEVRDELRELKRQYLLR